MWTQIDLVFPHCENPCFTPWAGPGDQSRDNMCHERPLLAFHWDILIDVTGTVKSNLRWTTATPVDIGRLVLVDWYNSSSTIRSPPEL